MKIKTITLGLLFILSNAVVAEENTSVDISISLYAFDYAQGHQDIFLVNKRGVAKEVRLSNANIIGPHETAMDENRIVKIRSKEISPEGDIIYPPIAKVKIPSTIKDPLLILLPQKEKNNEQYKALTIDRDMTNFPNGSYKVINFSNRNVRGVVGETKIAATAKKITSFRVTKNVERKLKVLFQFQREKDWKTFTLTSWVKEPEKRSLLCIYQDPDSKRMRIRGIPVISYQIEPKKSAAK